MCAKKFLSTPSARRATIISSIIVLPLSISIHALREEGDIVHGIGESLSFISIHALREEGDLGGQSAPIMQGLFLSTPSARRATLKSVILSPSHLSFLSTPSARRATADHQHPCWRIPISIHALREEGDCPPESGKYPADNFYPRPPRGGRHKSGFYQVRKTEFLSTPSARRATMPHPHLTRDEAISIHALREEGDLAAEGAFW